MLFDAATSKFFVLNPTMAFIWSRCDGEHSLEDIAAEMAGKFEGTNGSQVDSDLRKAAEELISLGLLKQTTSATVIAG